MSGVPLGPEACVDAAVCSRHPLPFPGCASHLKAAGRVAAPLKLRTRLTGGSSSEPAVEPGDGAGEAGMGRQEQEGREGPVVTAQLLQLGGCCSSSFRTPVHLTSLPLPSRNSSSVPWSSAPPIDALQVLPISLHRGCKSTTKQSKILFKLFFLRLVFFFFI